MKRIRTINKAYNSLFKPDELSIGVVVPIENYDQGPVPTMHHHLERVQLLETLGYKAVWLRGCFLLMFPLLVMLVRLLTHYLFGIFRQGQTTEIALGVSSMLCLYIIRYT